MGQKHGSGGFPLPRQKPTPIPRCRDCTIAFRNCKSFLPKRNCRRMVSTDTTRRQLTIRSNQISGNLTLLTNQFATNAVRASAVSLDFSSPAVCAISAAIASLSIFSLSSRKACLKSNDYSVFKDALGKRIQLLRTAASLTQEALAANSGLTRTTIVDIEKGATNPTLEGLARIASALGLKVPDLFSSGVAHQSTYIMQPTSGNLYTPLVEQL